MVVPARLWHEHTDRVNSSGYPDDVLDAEAVVENLSDIMRLSKQSHIHIGSKRRSCTLLYRRTPHEKAQCLDTLVIYAKTSSPPLKIRNLQIDLFW